MSDFEIVIVDDQACPGCGAYWGNPDPALDFPNRVKVDTHWKCYNPECEVGYYEDGEIIELKPSPEEAAASIARVQAEVNAMMEGKKWVKTSPDDAPYETWSLVPVDDGADT